MVQTRRLCRKNLLKGQELAIEGRLVNNTYTDKQDVKRTVSEIVLNEILLLSKQKTQKRQNKSVQFVSLPPMQTNDTLKPTLHTILTPSLLELYEIKDSIVVIIDVFRATSTMATALFNGASKIIPVDSAEHCIEWANKRVGLLQAKEMEKLFLV